MWLTSVNVGQEEAIANAKALGVTGIFKKPIAEAVEVTRLGLAGDTICDVENHGGVDQAVYVFGVPDYEHWSRILGRSLAPATFGENLTIADLRSHEVAVGDRLHISSVVLEVTAPRIPCVTLAVRMDDPAFLKLFRQVERPGIYCRVLEEGQLRVGDAVRIGAAGGQRVLAIELFREFFAPSGDEAILRRHLAAPIAIRARRDKERQLQQITRASE